jgi:hypothetical protein
MPKVNRRMGFSISLLRGFLYNRAASFRDINKMKEINRNKVIIINI